MNPSRLKFGDFELDAALYELSRRGRAVKLERIPMELLLLLVDRRGQLVTREEILEKLWGKDAFLDVNNSINTAVSKIRVVLKDDPESPAFIKTVPGRGYRFIASITSLPSGHDAFKASTDCVSGPTEATVAEEPALALASETKSSSRPRRFWLASVTAGVVVVATLAGWNWRDSLRRLVSPGRPAIIGSLAVLPLENLTGDAS